MTELNKPVEPFKLLFHIGYPKTASTWLQKFVFTNHTMGFCIPWENSRSMAIEQFRIANPFKFNAQQAIKQFKDGIFVAQKDSDIAVISDETLGGDPLGWETNARVIADRIYAAFPDAAIFICIREQKKMIRSLYSEYIKQGNTVTVEEFIGVVNRRPGTAPLCDIEQLEYDNLIEYYKKLYGNRVLVLTYEQLKQNRQQFLGELVGFTTNDGKVPGFGEERSNVSLGAATLELRRLLNHMVSKPDWTNSRQPISYRLVSRIVKIADKLIPQFLQSRVENKIRMAISYNIADRYVTSNKRTAEITGLDLNGYGYD